VVLAAIAGDSVGYEVGRHFGPRILLVGPLRRHQNRLSDAQAFLAERGGSAVFLGRFIAFFRAVMPALAGISHMPYRRFLTFNAAGGFVWGITFVCLGYFAGNSYARIEKAVGRDLALVILVLALVGLVVWRVRRSRAERDEETTPPAEIVD
jgi:membrane protein DedA with SNARE-associated domain